MKFGRILVDTPDGQLTRLVAVVPDEQRVVDLAAAERLRREGRGAAPDAARRIAVALFPASMSAALASGPEFRETAERAVDERGSDATLGFDQLTWAAPLDPPVLRDCIAFEQHLVNYFARVGQPLNELHYEIPGYYKGSPTLVVGHEAEIPWPSYTDWMDFELELGFVVGAAGHDLDPDQAQSHIFGVTIFNDFSARDIQSRETRLAMGPTKSKDFANAVGPWITTTDELDLSALDMRARVNDVEWSHGVSNGMIWSPAELIAYISMGDQLQPGDLVGSGTLGRGSGLELQRQLQPGDVVELEVSGIGVLRNRLGKPQPAGWRPSARHPQLQPNL